MKAKRQAMILQIVSSRDVQTQEELLEALQKEGFNCTQATISRDIKDLRIIKEMTKFGTYRYVSSAKDVNGTFSSRMKNIFCECLNGYDYAQNLVVLHTLPGLADAAASAIDSMKMRIILGTIAGDDTVLIVMRDQNAAAAFCSEIKNQLG